MTEILREIFPDVRLSRTRRLDSKPHSPPGNLKKGPKRFPVVDGGLVRAWARGKIFNLTAYDIPHELDPLGLQGLFAGEIVLGHIVV